MKSTWFTSKSHYEFAKLIYEAGGYSQRLYDCFTSFLDCASLSFKQAMHRFMQEEICPYKEAEYMRIIKRFKEPDKFPKAFQVLVNGLEEEPHDFLGGVFQALELNDVAFRGQVFTPDSINQVLAQMVLRDVEPDGYHLFNRMMIHEPACGSGAVLLKAGLQLIKNGFSPRQFFMMASDVDLKCVKMCYIQLQLMDLPAIVEHRNTLSREGWKVYPTMAALRYPLYEANNPWSCNIA